MTGWASCTVCAGANANGPVATYSMVENQASPSLEAVLAANSASAEKLLIQTLSGGSSLVAADSATHLKYDVAFYITNPGVAQALEFDNNQSNGAHKFIYGTQCNIKGNHWECMGQRSWELDFHRDRLLGANGICLASHLTWEFQRTSTNVIFVGFTYDGVTHYVNRSYPARSSTVHENECGLPDGRRFCHARLFNLAGQSYAHVLGSGLVVLRACDPEGTSSENSCEYYERINIHEHEMGADSNPLHSFLELSSCRIT